MAMVVRFTALDDACYFVNQLRGLPTVPNANPTRERVARASIILSWVGLEELLHCSIDEYSYRTRADFPAGAKVLQLLVYAAAVNEKTVNITDLEKARDIRNNVTHYRSNSVQVGALTEQNCQFVFDTCLAAGRAVWPNAFICRE